MRSILYILNLLFLAQLLGCSSPCGRAADLCGDSGDFSGDCTGQLRAFADCIVDNDDCSAATIDKCSKQSIIDDASVKPNTSNASNVIKETPYYFPQTTIGKEVDLLFVVDNSNSMAEEQVNLAANFSKLIDALRNHKLGADGSGKPCNEANRAGCKIPNVHIGVISADLGAGPYTSLPSCEVVGGDKGKLQNAARIAGCTPPSDPYISYEDGKTNIPGSDDPIEMVTDAFNCIAKLGTGGCGFEQQLQAARLALEPDANPGFLREDALLAIVFITDEDDCSARNTTLFDPEQDESSELGPFPFRCFEFGISCDINDRNVMGPRKDCVPAHNWLFEVKGYVDFFKKLKRPGEVVVAAISGPTSYVMVGREDGEPTLRQSCQSAQGGAVPAIRIEALVKAFAPDSQFTSICNAHFGPALTALGRKILGKAAQCIDLEPSIDADCVVKEEPTNETIPKCPGALWMGADPDCGDTCPCWRLIEKPACDKGALDILRKGDPPPAAIAAVRCQ